MQTWVQTLIDNVLDTIQLVGAWSLNQKPGRPVALGLKPDLEGADKLEA